MTTIRTCGECGRSVVVLTQATSKFRARLIALARGSAELLAAPVESAPPAPTRQHQQRLNPAEVAQLVAEYEAGDDMQGRAKTWVCTGRLV